MNARKRLLDAMERCLESTPIDDIKVGDIVSAADVSRQTFYRLYEDKFALLKDFYKTVIFPFYEDMLSPQSVYEGTCRTLQYLQSHKNVAKHMFFSRDMYALESFLREFCCESDTELWQAQGVDVEDERISGAIRLYAYGTTAFLMDWIKKGCPGDLDTVTAQFVLAIPVGVVENERAQSFIEGYRG